MKHSTSKKIAIFLLVVFFFFTGKTAHAFISPINPFGGRVVLWSPVAPGCVSFTAAVAIATLGTVIPTVEELIVAPPHGGTFGILRVNGIPVPPTTIHIYNQYQLPGTNVLGSSINICDACDAIDEIPFLKGVCEMGILKDILGVICDFVGGTCPITNLIFKMGTALNPSL